MHVLEIMKKNNLHPDDIGRVYVATESSIRRIKSDEFICCWNVEQVYGESSFEHAGGIECKFACVSGSYAIYDNTNWIRAEENNGKAAIVVVTDIAKYDIRISRRIYTGSRSSRTSDKGRTRDY